MMDHNKRGAANSFDKEFSLDNKPRTRVRGGKLPSWIWVVLAAAVIAVVVIARKPSVKNEANTPAVQSAAVNAEAANVTSGGSAVYGDQQVSEAEAQAFLASLQRPVAQSADGDPVFMVQETPFAMRLVPEETESTAEPGTRRTIVIDGKTYVIEIHEVSAEDESAENETAGTIELDGQSMEIGLDPAEESDADAVVINEQAFRLVVTPAAPTEEAVVEVTEEVTEEVVEEVTEEVTEEVVEEVTEEPVEAEPTSAPVGTSIAASIISETAEAKTIEFESDEEPFAEEPTAEPTEEPKQESWFVRMFNSIFGANQSTPEPTATPGVTVIPQEESAAVVSLATAEPTAEAVKLDEEEGSELESKTITLVDKGDLDDAPLYDPDAVEEEPTKTPAPTATAASAESGPVQLATRPATAVPTKTPVPVSIASEPTKLVVTVAAELPHTGGAEDWNIPAMLLAFVVLVVVVFVTRKLRSARKER